jgi:hypothetical protein
MKDFHLKRDIFGTALRPRTVVPEVHFGNLGCTRFPKLRKFLPMRSRNRVVWEPLGLNSTESRVQTTNGQPTRRTFGYSLATSATDNANFSKRFRSFYNLSWAEIGELKTPRKVASGKAWRASVVASPRQGIYRSMLFTEVWPT